VIKRWGTNEKKRKEKKVKGEKEKGGVVGKEIKLNKK
jgi:hypothetical protein